MLNIAIVDDELVFLDKLKSLILQNYKTIISNIDLYSEPEVFLSSQNIYDLVFLDIDMPKINGLDVAKIIGDYDRKPLLIFITNHNEYVYDSFKVSPFRYILKNRLDDINEALDSAVKKIKASKVSKIFKSEKNNENIKLSTIVAFTSIGHNVYLCDDKNRKIKIYETLNELTSELEKYGFVRIHKSYIVNLQYIKQITSKYVILFDNSQLPISRRNFATVKERFVKYYE